MSVTRLLSTVAATALLATAAAAQAPAPAAPPAVEAPARPAPVPVISNVNIVDTLKASGKFKMTLKALDVTGILPVLRTPGPLAFLAPTDTAFSNLPADVRAKLLAPENAEALQKVMVYHLINTRMDPAKISGTKGQIMTVEGHEVSIDGSGAQLMFNNATVQGEPVAATNGVIYVIDQVLLPPSVIPASLPGHTDPQVPSLPITAPPPATAGMAANIAGGQGLNAAAQTVPAAPEGPATDPSAGPSQPAQDSQPAVDPNAPMSGMAMSPPPADQAKPGDPGVVTNGAVPDTPESRANNGQPMSNAGKETPPAGN